MKKYIYCLLAIILLGATYNDSYAAWYNSHPMWLSNSNCDTDSESDATWPLPLSNYAIQAQVSPTGSFPPGPGWRNCEWWDATDPSVSANNASATWNKNNITVTLSRSDYGGSGLGSSSYKWDSPCTSGGATAFINGSTTIQSTNGDHTLYLCAIDGAGNTSYNVAYGPYRHDHDLPTISATLSSVSWKNADITPIVISTGDTGGSGIRYAKYIWDDTDANCRASGTNVSGSISQTTNGAHVLRLCIEDWAGNQASWIGDYKLDKLAPTVTADNSSVSWKNTAITINLGVGDTGGSSILQSKYVWHMNNIGPAPTLAFCLASGTPFTNGSQIFRNTSPDQGDHTLYLCAQDVALNTVIQAFGPYRYDTVDPTVSANNNSLVWQNADYSATLFVNDPVPYAGAVVSDTTAPKRKYIWSYNLGPAPTIATCLSSGTTFNNGTIIPVNVEGDHTLYLCAEDQATNQATMWSGRYRLDKTRPTVNLLTYANASTNGWTNNTSINLTWTAMDPPAAVPAGVIASQVKNYDINVYCKFGAQGTPTASDLCATIPAASTTTNYTYVGTNGYSYKFEVCPRDNANNTCASWLASADIARIDTVNPDPNNLSDTSAINMIANTSQAFNFTFTDVGAPVQINYTFEQNTAPGVSDLLVTPSYSYAHAYNRDISLVDNDRGANGGRELSIQITQMCDWAGNCINTPSPLKTITHYSYADATNSTATSTNTSITDGTAIADGTPKIFETTIKDQFGNQLIPASGISRSVDLTLSGIVNSMYLNQYTRSALTSVFLTASNNPVDEPLNFISTQSFANPMVSNNGIYPLQIKAYTPTANSYTGSDAVSDPLANFGFTANYVINDVLSPTKTLSQTLANPNFKPLYVSNIVGDLRFGGFIEGTEQSSSITNINNNPGAVTSALELQLEFSGANANKFNFYGSNTPGNTIPIGAKSVMSPNPGLTATSLYSKLEQKQNTQVNNLSDIQFSTHYSYMIDGHSVTYNSDIIGRIGGYWSNTLLTVGSQVGVKIIGSIGSNSINSIVTNQFAAGASIFDGYNRSNVRNSVRKSIALATRNSIPAAYAPSITNVSILDAGTGVNGTRISNSPNESLIVLERNGGAVTKIDLDITAAGISGRRTIVVKGLDLFIKSDMYYSTPDSILGIVVQKDENGNGGNLYISPNITNMVGSYVIDGSVMSSSNGINPIGTSNIGLLKNQLYIFGSIVSENTIGGSRILPLKCPSLVNTTCSTVDEAQKYDLNYLRRYYLYNGEPFGTFTTKVIGGGNCSGVSCGSFNVNLIKKFTIPSEDYARYPVIIEYNPLVRTKSPIGFEETLN